MLHLLRWPSLSATSDDGPPCDSSLSDDKCETTFPSSVSSSATHLPEAATKSQTLTCFVGDEAGISLDGIPCSRPLTTPRVLAAHIGAALTLFLATTDATIVSTSLPTIIREFDGSHSEYTWIGVAYLLTQTACQPLYGRISDLTGRKCVLFSSILIFALGSLLCGAARDLKWLIAARALSGIGGGGIVSSVWVITSELVEVANRAKWSQALSVTWSCSAIAGPLLGGLFSSQHSSFLSWRWAFYLNLPICLMGALVLALSLNGVQLEGPKSAFWKDFLRKFDFVGLLLFMGGTSCIIVGFSFASALSWTAPLTLTLVIGGTGLLISAGVYEVRTTRDALFPQAIFSNFNIIILLAVSLLHNVAFNAGTFYLALYYQTVNASISNLRAGVMLLPYSLGSSLASIPVAWFLGAIQGRTHNTFGQKWVISTGLFISTVALLWLLDENTRIIMQSFLPLLCGFGIGMLFHAPYQALTSVLSPKELAAGTGAFFLVRFTGATVGLSIAGAIYQSSISRQVLHGASLAYPSASTSLGQVPIAITVSAFRVGDSQDTVLSLVILNFGSRVQDVWTMCAPCLGGALLVRQIVILHEYWALTSRSRSSPSSCARHHCQRQQLLKVQRRLSDAK
ncbi:MFS general substrate transporter [Russula ochroleuca]|uniref:MFS general substrate transporter n=1 Tax=Russula ochroleuca TaxID=152965 RepID=A0A9P5MYI8_9AGAM|nr:MFS general substrate transporter [Russula ochroleuca]